MKIYKKLLLIGLLWTGGLESTALKAQSVSDITATVIDSAASLYVTAHITAPEQIRTLFVSLSTADEHELLSKALPVAATKDVLYLQDGDRYQRITSGTNTFTLPLESDKYPGPLHLVIFLQNHQGAYTEQVTVPIKRNAL